MTTLTADEQREDISLGSRVVVEDLDDGTRETFVLVPPAESDPAEGLLSIESPVARAIAHHRSGDVVEARVPHGIRHLRVTALARLTGHASGPTTDGNQG